MLTIGIVIISVSMLLYNLSRNVRDRVARSSGILLACISWVYFVDIVVGLQPAPPILETWFRVQWVGVALVPAAMFHLSDALLATTGLVSRGRRRKAVRALYITGTGFVGVALFTDLLIRDLTPTPVWHMGAGEFFGLYLLYFLIASSFAVFNVIRAWQRCLTTYTRRRMTYLMAAFTTPAWGIFPYSLLFSLFPSGMATVPEGLLWLIFNIANLAVLAMLAFMAYPLSFFGQDKPERIIRLELLQFMLRGPLTGLVIVAVLQTIPRVERILGIDAQAFVTLTVVAAVLCMQWGISLLMPLLETQLVYTQDQEQVRIFQEFSQRLLTRADAEQMLEAILAALCDHFRVPTAFIVSTFYPTGPRLEQYVGLGPEESAKIELHFADDFSEGKLTEKLAAAEHFFTWENFWLLPLRYIHEQEEGALLGVLGIWARSETPNLSEDDQQILVALTERTIDILTDISVQSEIIRTIENLLPAKSNRALQAKVSPFGQISLQAVTRQDSSTQIDNGIIDHPQFVEMVRDALRYYWGGTKLNESLLLNLQLVKTKSLQTEGNQVNALRQVLSEAIERLRPEGERSFTRTDWILYNILEMRFIQGRKVRETARRLSMSDSDFYRKQNIAIEQVAKQIQEAERECQAKKISPQAEVLENLN